jgi:hypothetical protein
MWLQEVLPDARPGSVGMCQCFYGVIGFPHVHRKRPFLVRPLENTLIKLLKSLDFYDESGREKIAIGTRPIGGST